MAILVALLLATRAYDSFDAPLAPGLWYIGVPAPPRDGTVRIPKGGWLVARNIPDKGIESIAIAFRHKGGSLVVTFHDREEPLSSPLGEPLAVTKAGGKRLLTFSAQGARLDGESVPFKGPLKGTFRIAAHKGDLELLEVRVSPAPEAPPPLGYLEERSVHFASTPPCFKEGERSFRRVSLMLWDAEVCFLLARGKTAFRKLGAKAQGAPTLGTAVTVDSGEALALKASSHPLAMRDWGDERGNLANREFWEYLAERYAVFELIQQAQRSLNAALPMREGLDALTHLAVIRHADNARAAVALAETQGAKEALSALRKAIGKKAELRRLSSDKIRAAAGRAARQILGEPPGQWPGFAFDPQSRFVTLQQAADLIR
ncbi:MAG: hypothetical protein ACYSX0_00580 [Planctomycetota bacterium]